MEKCRRVCRTCQWAAYKGVLRVCEAREDMSTQANWTDRHKIHHPIRKKYFGYASNSAETQRMERYRLFRTWESLATWQESSSCTFHVFAAAQTESEGKSWNIELGILDGFQQGTSGYANTVRFGYKAGDGDQFAIDELILKLCGRCLNCAQRVSALERFQTCYMSIISFRQPARNVRGGKQSASFYITRNARLAFYCRRCFWMTASQAVRKIMLSSTHSIVQNHHPAITGVEKFEKAQR